MPDTDFESAWHKVLVQRQTLFELLLSLVRLTSAGRRPVALQDLATDLRRPVEEAELLVKELAPEGRAWFGARVEDGLVQFGLNGDTVKARYRYHIDDRDLPVDGCAPDSFIVAYGLGQPFWVESSCPATGTPIRVDFAAGGARTATPASAVVAIIHPDGGLDDVCVRQPFFASEEAASGWLERHPRGMALPVLDFDRMWSRLLHGIRPQS